VEAMGHKLNKHYTLTAIPYVYSDAVILNPNIRMRMFNEEWDDRYGEGTAKEYRENCHRRFLEGYAVDNPSTTNKTASSIVPRKRKLSEASQDPTFAKWVKSLHKNDTPQDEFETYLTAKIAYPPELELQSVLDWWKNNSSVFPGLANMARDVFAVPCSGAGVEREFSKGRRTATWGRSRLHPDTIQRCMMYKDYLSRMGKPLEKWDVDAEEETKDLQKEIDEYYVPMDWEEDWWNDKLYEGM
jgi:hAT family C-terminal dimerisation region